MVERHLTYAAIRTRLTPHLNCIHPPSTNTIHIPCIFAAQGPSDVKKGEDSLECHACRELTTLWVARLNEGTELKVTDPKEQQGDVEKEKAEDKERREQVDCW